MQATHSDIFAFKTSGLDAFLYADVGAEVNGSTLTILSILARLGKDPWKEAARWAALPQAAAIDSLARSIAEMPLAPSALASARDSATRLVQLLPTNGQSSAATSATAAPKLVRITMLYFALAVGIALNVILMPKPSSDVPASIGHPTANAAAIHTAMRSLPEGTAVAGSPAIPAPHEQVPPP